MSSLPLTPADALPTPVPATSSLDADAGPLDAWSARQRPTLLRCSDGRLLAAQWFEPPEAVGVKAVAVIGSATAVPASYYRHFAEWLARRGYAVLSFDYRGIAASREALQPGEDVRLRDWARLDMGAAVHAATAAVARKPMPKAARWACCGSATRWAAIRSGWCRASWTR